MIIVKIENTNTEEEIKANKEYLEYNGYGSLIVEIKKDHYICFGGTRKFLDLGDVELVFVSKALLSNYVSLSEQDYLLQKN